MGYPTLTELKGWANRLKKEDPSIDPYALAIPVLHRFLGKEWCDANLEPRPGTVGANGGDYFKLALESKEDRLRHMDRAVLVSEMLFNLQGVEGFGDKLRSLQRDNVEAYVAEFQAAALLHGAGVSFRFRQTVGEKGQDYDLEIYLDDEILAAGNTKCKVETTELSEDTILNSLEDARKKLPKDQAGFVFMKIPESWVRKPNFRQVVTAGIRNKLRQTGRITTVFIWWEEWDFSPGTPVSRVFLGKGRKK